MGLSSALMSMHDSPPASNLGPRPTEAASKEALIRLADERMYQDKERRKQG